MGEGDARQAFFDSRGSGIYRTGRFVEYLRVFVDNSTTPVTFWVGSNHGASIVKLEPLD